MAQSAPLNGPSNLGALLLSQEYLQKKTTGKQVPPRPPLTD